MTWSSTDPRRRSGLSSIGANLNKLPHGFPCTGIPLDYLARIRACHPERSEGFPRQSGGFFASLRMTILARVIPAREIGVPSTLPRGGECAVTIHIPKGGERESNYLRHESADVPYCRRAAEEDEEARGLAANAAAPVERKATTSGGAAL